MRSVSAWLLGVLLPPTDRGHVLAELDELHELRGRRVGREEADLWYRRQARRFTLRIFFSVLGTRRSGERTTNDQSRPIKPPRRLLPFRDQKISSERREKRKAIAFSLLSSCSIFVFQNSGKKSVI